MHLSLENVTIGQVVLFILAYLIMKKVCVSVYGSFKRRRNPG